MQNVLSYKFLDQLKSLGFINEIWLFGSRARGDHRERSDIDLAILCPDATDADWLTVMEIVEDADTLLKVDCVRFDQKLLNDELYKNIVRDKVIIYVKDAN